MTRRAVCGQSATLVSFTGASPGREAREHRSAQGHCSHAAPAFRRQSESGASKKDCRRARTDPRRLTGWRNGDNLNE
jgi:hypothetical protein